MDIRVRFAPSPTGPLHIGGVRTALFNYLFAKKNGGKFILRIEDTDQSRYVKGAEEYITESLKWCGIEIDEGYTKGGEHAPYKQSERKDIYKKHAEELIKNGWAYYAFDTAEEIDQIRQEFEARKQTFTYNQIERKKLKNSIALSEQEVQNLLKEKTPYVIRFKTPEDETIEMNDIVRGKIKVNTNTLDDKVLFKSDGLPTYHLANVVDDHLMKISHVIRGEEWLPSLPLHYMLYKALGWENDKPEFAHLSLLLKPTGKGKLSKRDGEKMGFPVFPLEWVGENDSKIAGYREEGYFPEAFVNIIALLGWNPGNDEEILSMSDLISQFDLNKVQKSGARFDPEKAKWFNHQYLIKKSDDEIAQLFSSVLEKKSISIDNSQLSRIIAMVKERVTFIHELWNQCYFFFEEPNQYDPKVVKKRWKNEIPKHIESITELINKVDNWKADELKESVSNYIQEKELGFGAIMNAIRLAIVGGALGPDLFEIIEIIGRESTINRLKKCVDTLG
jgi:glutamyl-tRNA synthetase